MKSDALCGLLSILDVYVQDEQWPWKGPFAKTVGEGTITPRQGLFVRWSFIAYPITYPIHRLASIASQRQAIREINRGRIIVGHRNEQANEIQEYAFYHFSDGIALFISPKTKQDSGGNRQEIRAQRPPWAKEDLKIASDHRRHRDRFEPSDVALSKALTKRRPVHRFPSMPGSAMPRIAREASVVDLDIPSRHSSRHLFFGIVLAGVVPPSSAR